MIEGNIFDLIPKQRKKAIKERAIWLLKNPMTWLMIGMIIFAMFYMVSYLAPTLEMQSKQMTCLDNGYFDYDSLTDTCYTYVHRMSDDYSCVSNGKCKGDN